MSDPVAPLPDDAPDFIRRFYDEVNRILTDNPDPSAREALHEIWQWMLHAYPPPRLPQPR